MEPARRQEADLEQLVDVGGRPGQLGREGDVLPRRQRRDEVEELEDEADAVALEGAERIRGQTRELPIADADTPGGGGVEAADEVQQRRLPGAARPQNDRELTSGEREIGGSERPHGDCRAVGLFRTLQLHVGDHDAATAKMLGAQNILLDQHSPMSVDVIEKLSPRGPLMTSCSPPLLPRISVDGTTSTVITSPAADGRTTVQFPDDVGWSVLVAAIFDD